MAADDDVEEYRRLFKDFVEHAKRPGALTVGPNVEPLREISAKLKEWQRTHTSYRVVCTKGHFAGQGTDWNEGDTHSTYYDREEAEALLKSLLTDSWNPGCWKLVEQSPEERNQCDGCRAGKPLDSNGNHRMGEGSYPDLMGCQAEKYRRAV